MTGEVETRRHHDPPDALVIEVTVIPLGRGGAEHPDRRLRAIVGLLREALAGRGDPELTSRSSSHLISSDGNVLSTSRHNEQQCLDRVGGPGTTDGAGRASCQTSSTSDSGGEGSSERWITKRQLAGHLGATVRWIEYQQRLGLPHLRMGGMNRYRVSEVDAWLRDRQGAAERGGCR